MHTTLTRAQSASLVLFLSFLVHLAANAQACRHGVMEAIFT
jgi:hypothetical protein